jgi:spermidine synthase
MCREHTPFYHDGAYDNPKAKLIIGDAKVGLCTSNSFDP